MLFLFSSNFAFLLSFWKRQTWVNVQFDLNKNCVLEVYGVFAVYHLGFSSNQFLSCTDKSQACKGPHWENIGPWSFLYGPRCTWSVLSRPLADILPVRPSRLVNKIYILTSRLVNNLQVYDRVNDTHKGKGGRRRDGASLKRNFIAYSPSPVPRRNSSLKYTTLHTFTHTCI